MKIICKVNALVPFIKKLLRMLGAAFLTGLFAAAAVAQDAPLVLQRDGRVISLVPYAPNIIRITMSTDMATATSAPGYGIIAQPSTKGWVHECDAQGYDVYRSARMVVRISPEIVGSIPTKTMNQAYTQNPEAENAVLLEDVKRGEF